MLAQNSIHVKCVNRVDLSENLLEANQPLCRVPTVIGFLLAVVFLSMIPVAGLAQVEVAEVDPFGEPPAQIEVSDDDPFGEPISARQNQSVDSTSEDLAKTYSVLVPQSPTEESLTSPAMLPLRAKPIKGNGEEARGTFATDNGPPVMPASQFGNDTFQPATPSNLNRPGPDDSAQGSFGDTSPPKPPVSSRSLPPITSNGLHGNSKSAMPQPPVTNGFQPPKQSSNIQATLGDSNRQQSSNFKGGFTPPVRTASNFNQVGQRNSNVQSNLSSRLGPQSNVPANQPPSMGMPIRSSISNNASNQVRPAGFSQEANSQGGFAPGVNNNSAPPVRNPNAVFDRAKASNASNSTSAPQQGVSGFNNLSNTGQSRVPNTSSNLNVSQPPVQSGGQPNVNAGRTQLGSGQLGAQPPAQRSNFGSPTRVPAQPISNNRALSNQPNRTTTNPALKTRVVPNNQPRIDTALAKAMIERFDVSRAPDPLPGDPTSLLEMLQKVPAYKHRQAVLQYWETYFDWANLSIAKEHEKALNAVQQPSVAADRTLLAAARQAAKNVVLANEIQLGKSQSILQELTGNQSLSQPIPADRPHIGGYQTFYDWYARKNMIPAKLRGVDKMLPKTLQLISNRAMTVRVSKSALNQAQSAYGSRQVPIASVLEAARLNHESEQDLISLIVSYNKAYADYSITVMGQTKSAEQIVEMLIKKRKPTTNGRQQQQTAGRQLKSNPNRPQTNPALVNQSKTNGSVSGRQTTMPQASFGQQRQSPPQPFTRQPVRQRAERNQTQQSTDSQFGGGFSQLQNSSRLGDQPPVNRGNTNSRPAFDRLLPNQDKTTNSGGNFNGGFQPPVQRSANRSGFGN